MLRFNAILQQPEERVLRVLSEGTQQSMSEVVRQLLRYCAKEENTNQVFPYISGQMRVQDK